MSAATPLSELPVADTFHNPEEWHPDVVIYSNKPNFQGNQLAITVPLRQSLNFISSMRSFLLCCLAFLGHSAYATYSMLLLSYILLSCDTQLD